MSASRSTSFLRTAALLLGAALGVACGGPLPEDADALGDSAAAANNCRGAPYPILMAHGMAGWNQIGGFWNYYYQVPDDLRSQGETIILSQVAPFESSTVRGAQLATAIDDALRTTGACKVNIIAHSQGGIDARYAISTLRRGDRVASLVTVSTPHRGTAVADVALGLLPGFSYTIINAVLRVYEAIVGAPAGDPGLRAQLQQLSSRQMATFNAQNPDDRRVAYYSVAGRSVSRLGADECRDGRWPNPGRSDILDPLFGGVQLVFTATSKNPLVPDLNDGLVTVASARWGTFLGCAPADHLDEIGQILHLGTDLISGFNHKDLYRRIAAQLHRDGF